jgi:hypothetical protein
MIIDINEDFIIRTIEPQPFPDGQVELYCNGLVRYRTMTREEFALEFPGAPMPERAA